MIFGHFFLLFKSRKPGPTAWTKAMASFASTEAAWTKTTGRCASIRHHDWSTHNVWTKKEYSGCTRKPPGPTFLVQENNLLFRLCDLKWGVH